MNLRALGIIHTGCKSLSRPLMNIIRFNTVCMVKQIKIWPTPSFCHLLNSRMSLNGFLLIILWEEKEAKSRLSSGLSNCKNVLFSLVVVDHIGTKAAKYQISFFSFLGSFSESFHFYPGLMSQCPFPPHQGHYPLSGWFCSMVPAFD